MNDVLGIQATSNADQKLEHSRDTRVILTQLRTEYYSRLFPTYTDLTPT